MMALRPALKEVLRYLGHHGQAMTEEFLAMAGAASTRYAGRLCRGTARLVFAGENRGGAEGGRHDADADGATLPSFLQNSRRCILLAATLGPRWMR